VKTTATQSNYVNNFKILKSISEISQEVWDALANPDGTAANPLVSHAFLSALEVSGCVSLRSGWKPHHVVVTDDGADILGAIPCYLKSHSMGEYVFDHAWADAYARAGGDYYPKLQVSVPFSPVTGPRILCALPEHRKALIAALKAQAEDCDASSVHLTFLQDQDAADLSDQGFLLRKDIQFHWRNNSYATFDDFLATLSSSKRKNIRKERRSVADAGISFEWATGASLTSAHWDYFYTCYMETGARKWGRPYLNRKFFELIHASMPEQILLVLAKREDKFIAAALNFIGGDTLFGRNWGATEDHSFLHFETCYYQAIDFAIARGLKVVEAGAQGEHKLARGYMPVQTTSAHYLRHPALQKAVAAYLKQEREAIAENQTLLAAHAPYKHAEEQD
jgi:uncharacterized protein